MGGGRAGGRAGGRSSGRAGGRAWTRERSLDGMAVRIRKLFRMNAGATRWRRSPARPPPEPKGMSSPALSFAAASSSFHTTTYCPSSRRSSTVPSQNSLSRRRAITDSPTAKVWFALSSALRLRVPPAGEPSFGSTSSCCDTQSATSSTHVPSCGLEATWGSAVARAGIRPSRQYEASATGEFLQAATTLRTAVRNGDASPVSRTLSSLSMSLLTLIIVVV